MTTTQIYENADKLLLILNGIIKLKYKMDGLTRSRNVSPAQKEPSELSRLDNQNRVVTTTAKTISARFNLSAGEDYLLVADRKRPSLVTIWNKARRHTNIKRALSYYAGQTDWSNLYRVYESIKPDVEQLINRNKLSQATYNSWVTDASGRNRENDFTETANNFNLAGTDSRHPAMRSFKVERQRKSSIVKVVIPNKKLGRPPKKVAVLPVSLDEAKVLIENVLIGWLKVKK